MPIISQTLNINNLGTTRAKSTNMKTIKKLIKYPLKNVIVIRDIAVQRLVGIINALAGYRK